MGKKKSSSMSKEVLVDEEASLSFIDVTPLVLLAYLAHD
jgi:hypothetical protein